MKHCLKKIIGGKAQSHISLQLTKNTMGVLLKKRDFKCFYYIISDYSWKLEWIVEEGKRI